MSLQPEILQQRYGAIERAYSERRWSDVENLSQELLAELEPNPADPLQLQLVLLLGHTRLYGLADPSAARHYYASVLEHCLEPTLRDIALQGQEQCDQYIQPVPGGEAAAPWLGNDGPIDAAGTLRPAAALANDSVDATPWIKPAAVEPPVEPQEEPDPEELPAVALAYGLVPEVVDEPEQIDLALVEQPSSPSSDQAAAYDQPAAAQAADPDADSLDELTEGLLRIRLS